MSVKGKFSLIFTALFLIFALGLRGEPRSAAFDESSIESVSKKVFPSVVKVETRNGRTRIATGVVVEKDGYIITTALISPRNEKIIVTTADGKKSEAKFLGLDPETHLALIQAKMDLTPIALGKAGDLAPGTWIGVISMSPENTPAVTQGIVSSVAADKLRLNVWVTRGASGSPVVNKDGQMIALLRGIYTEDQPVVFEFREREVVGSGYVFNRGEAPSSGMAEGIPVDIVRMVAGEIKEKGRVSRGWVGISISENEEGRVEINEVEDKSPAELAKLKKGDFIVEVDGKQVTSAPMFVSEIRARKPGQDISVKVEREGKAVEVKVKLGEYPEGEAQREMELRFPRLFPPPAPQPPKAIEVKPEKIPQPDRGKLEQLLKVRPAWEKRKYIGVYLETINKELLAFFGVKEENGLLVTSLTKDGPAEKAGFKVGDVIVRVEGKTVKQVSDLSEIIQDKKKGDKVKLELVRDKKPMSLEVEVAEDESSSFFWRYEASPEFYAGMSRELAEQYGKSKEIYKKFSAETKEKMKKLNETMYDQSKKYYELSKDALAKSKESARDLYKLALSKSRVFYRV